MTIGEQLYLAMVLVAFATFALMVGFLARSDAKHDRQLPQGASAPSKSEPNIHRAA